MDIHLQKTDPMSEKQSLLCMIKFMCIYACKHEKMEVSAATDWSDRSFQPAVVVRNAVHVFLSHLCYCGQYYSPPLSTLMLLFIITVGDNTR